MATATGQAGASERVSVVAEVTEVLLAQGESKGVNGFSQATLCPCALWCGMARLGVSGRRVF
jgi:hypothetical protein